MLDNWLEPDLTGPSEEHGERGTASRGLWLKAMGWGVSEKREGQDLEVSLCWKLLPRGSVGKNLHTR
jgi:hypothetical protein